MNKNSNYRRISSALVTQISIIVALVAGCAGIEERHYEVARERTLSDLHTLKDVVICCSDFSELEYVQLDHEREIFSFGGEEAKIYGFDSGPSYFSAIDLSPGASGENIFVRSILWRPSRDQLEVFVVPSVLALDQDYQEIGRVDALPLCFHAGWSEVGYYGSITIKSEDVRYLILYTKPDVVANETHFRRSATAAGGGVITSGTVDRMVPHSPSGDIQLWYGIDPKSFPSRRCSTSNNAVIGK